MAQASRTSPKLRKQIDQLGRLRDELAGLKASERQLSSEVQAAMAAGGHDTVASTGYIATLASRTELRIDLAKLRRKAGTKIFLDCIRVDTKAARRHFPEAVLEGMGERVERTVLRISAKAGG